MQIQIAPSLLAADFTRLGEQIRQVEDAHADRLHLDIMDGHFVPNITFGPAWVSSLRQLTRLPLETHLMIEEPDKFLEVFAQAGADIIILHAEVTANLPELLAKIHSLGLKNGISLKPKTPLETIHAYLSYVDLILFMTVEPGFGGQVFMPEVLPKIRQCREWIQKQGLKIDIEVDGGISPVTAGQVIEAGANILVAGTAIFNQPDPAAVIQVLKNFSK